MLNIQTCYKSLLVATFCTTILVPNISSAASIANGDFSTGDFTGWSQDIDGSGTPTFGLNDFLIASPNNAARIEIDYWLTPGDTTSTANDEAWFASTLYQGLDLSASAGQNLVLSFDWSFSGQDSLFDENFLVALGDGTGDYYGADGNLGFLLNPLDYGSGAYSIILDSSFANTTGWTLEFQMNTGFDGYGSYIEIDNVSLDAVSKAATVPEPSVLFLMVSGLICLVSFQRKGKVVYLY